MIINGLSMKTYKTLAIAISNIIIFILSSSIATASSLKVASIQYRSILSNKTKNIINISSLVKEASVNGAKIIVLPEMCTTGLNIKNAEEATILAEPIPGPSTNTFAKLAARCKIYLILGLAESERNTNKFYNSQIILGPNGQIIGKYRKMHLYGPDHNWAEKGDLGYQAVNTEWGRIGLGICNDINYQDFIDFISGGHVNIFAFSTNWIGYNSPFHYWSKQVANGSFYFIAANNWGEEGNSHFSGGSIILSPDLSVLSQSHSSANKILYATIDIKR
jgi:predicted amidohydrolase